MVMQRSILSVKFNYKTYGAQQSDQDSASLIYRKLGFEVTECLVDLVTKKAKFYPEKNLQKLKIYNKTLIYLRYLRYYIVNFDNAQREYYTLDNFYNISIFAANLNHPIIIAENSDLTFLTFVTKCCRYTRSVNFAPIHSLKEYNRVKGLGLFLSRLYSVIIERLCNNILSIDEKDLRLYGRIPSNKKMEVLGLRNLLVNQEVQFKSIDFDNIKPGFTSLASTYNVNHNLKNLNFFYSAFESYRIENVTFNVYGTKVPNLKFDEHFFKLRGWVKNINQIFDENDLFVAMYGGTGQMMKLYEPLSKGKLLIANPDLLEHSKFLPNVHFLPASNPYQFISQIAYSICNPLKVKKYRIAGFELFHQVFNLEAHLNKLSFFFNNHT